jgi:hypothetical protein
MVKKGAVIFALAMIIGFGLIIAVPISVLSVSLSPYDIISKTPFVEYTPDSPSTIEKLNLNVDIGDIEIRYIDPPVDYFVRIDVNIEMAGAGLAGKSYSNYFNITRSGNINSPFDFSMRLFSNITQSEVDSLIRGVSITVTLRKGIIFDISATVIDGNVDLKVPFKVNINNINFNLKNSNIFLGLTKCFIGGNITVIVDNGKLKLKSYNAEYTQNSRWALSANKSYIEITQQNSLGANVTGTISTSLDKPTNLIYNDTTPEVGAKFTLYNYNYGGTWNETREGFSRFMLEPFGINTYSSKSDDFPTNYNYILALYLEGILYPNLYSA